MKILLLGSGALKIGEAGEFDYSGSQAIKTFKKSGHEVLLINPNIATIQTDPNWNNNENFTGADKVFFLPVTPEFVEKIIETEKPDALALSFGGQTALNCGLALEKSGVLKKFGVKVLGTPVDAIDATENREIFVKKLDEIGVHTPRSIAAHSIENAKKAAEKIGFPLIMRAGFALGGKGSGFCEKKEDFEKMAKEAFAFSPQVLVEEDLRGWKEIEYEVVRDGADNCITVVNMENFDPLGIHTGESIVISPSMTLANREYQLLRTIAIRTIRHLKIVGECNIQYALDPDDDQNYRVIEVNARLSRSSALASKASGYPLAAVAAEILLGKNLPEIPNAITQKTTAFFEPALDYLAVKIPRWDLQKFRKVSEEISTEMKSVGEVMALGRNFPEAIQKAVRMLAIGSEGVLDSPVNFKTSELEKKLRIASPQRIFVVAQALFSGKFSVEKIWELTKIDHWFLQQLERITDGAKKLDAVKSLDAENLRDAKVLGFSDSEIARRTGKTFLEVRELRKKFGIIPVTKQIDTLAAEFPAQTNYLYTTYLGEKNDA
ncbi:carbamoyl-phosphate synthase large subunit [bacterium]|jgi:carbamoyl-phosphate synthase large subunit|nr:carbamoyl-phosphate synthase large subunit [bacterium]MBT6832192.1 carbamoyl-phosphate synthase large subunit [bacterium]MBT6996137.1 carbamoyl-phosphate synthase large subunit [bacterium]MBT7772217.1 carbamoyl-phosphate synthase large subunit [bacterium]